MEHTYIFKNVLFIWNANLTGCAELSGNISSKASSLVTWNQRVLELEYLTNSSSKGNNLI